MSFLIKPKVDDSLLIQVFCTNREREIVFALICYNIRKSTMNRLPNFGLNEESIDLYVLAKYKQKLKLKTFILHTNVRNFTTQ